MQHNLPKKLEEKIETFCEQGCSQINQIIDGVKKGEKIEGLEEFNGSEIEQIIDELSKIMSVYDE
ncbi:hypothetical protein MNBD_GAMMA05-491 [hydrothermal vent metagenome]|uniref:Uncharacterized protein n=1 Tax=hydrothermal vent metagenome TaxID=652676 RepID=A0A3B0WJL0_9ZZZZ